MDRLALETKIGSSLKEAGLSLQEGIALASLDVVLAAVRLEKGFDVKFSLDEISLENFSSIRKIADLVELKLKDRGR